MYKYQASEFIPSSDKLARVRGDLSQEASMLHWRPGQHLAEFAIVVDGQEIDVFLFHTEREDVCTGGDICYWEFKPVDRRFTWSVKVWND